MLSAFDQAVAAVDKDGMVTERFRAFIQAIVTEVNNKEPSTGSGSPEGVLQSATGRWYVDTDAAAGTGIYFKESGSGDTGWVQRS